jgi:YidC/Oxa1 family membrane protein insertase
MDNQRLILFIALSFVLLLIWQAWMKDYGTPPSAPSPATGEEPRPVAGGAEDLPSAVSGESLSAPLAERRPMSQAKRVRVQTDLLAVEIDTKGGDVRSARLLKYPISAKPDSPPFQLLNDSLPNLFIVQSGLRTPDGAEPTHHVVYTAEQDTYRLGAEDDQIIVTLRWRSPEGVDIAKIYTFRRGSYLVEIEHRIRNNSGADWRARQYQQLQRTEPVKSGQSTFIYTYTGGVIYSPEEKYEKIKFDHMAEEPLNREITGGWAAMIQHYFLAAWIPPAEGPEQYYSKVVDGSRYVLGMISPTTTIADNDSAAFSSRLYIGPKLQDSLANIAPGLELTVDYGILTVLAQPLFWLLENIHKIVGNWGWSIVLLTLLIKLAFFKLSETSYRSMANMRKLTPRLQSLKERYADDKQRLNQAMMELYKKEKINPLGGCLPILVQIPVFIALYWVLLESVEMRQAPFILWWNDLSSPDPYFVLPVLMGITMLIQQRLNPAPMDPVQAKVMMILPVVFTVFFAFFPQGLVLYWVVNNTLSIAQQWAITRRIERKTR